MQPTELERIINEVAKCDGLGCPVSNDCLHFYSKKNSDMLLSPFNFIEAYCSEFVSYQCTKHLLDIKENITTLDELIDAKYGELGTPKRDEFEVKSKKFIEKELKKIKEQ